MPCPMIPDRILINPEFFGPPQLGDPWGTAAVCARVTLIFRDSTGDLNCTFEVPELAGTYTIHLGSTFWLGWATTECGLGVPAESRIGWDAS